jgi:hypothetical protein
VRDDTLGGAVFLTVGAVVVLGAGFDAGVSAVSTVHAPKATAVMNGSNLRIDEPHYIY